MNIKTESGVFEVKQARALVEKRFKYNGNTRRLCEIVTTNLDEANGLVFYLGYDATSLFDASAMHDFCILNLPNKYVQKVLDNLNEKGYADLSELQYQNCKSFNTMDYKFDNGEGLPYKTDIFVGFASNSACMGLQQVQSSFASTERVSEDDEEDNEE